MNFQKSNLIEKTITLVDVQENNGLVKVTDEQNNFYSFFQNKKDGNMSQAAVDIQNFQLGQQVNVVYEEREGTNGGKFRNIARVKPAGGQVTTTHTQPKTPGYFKNPYKEQVATHPVPTQYNASLPKDVSITAQAFAKSLLESNQASKQDLVNPEWWSTFIFPAIGAMLTAGNAVNATLDEDINVDDIPF